MKKSFLKALGIAGLGAACWMGATSEIRSPLSLYYGPTHYLLDPVEPVEGDTLTWRMWSAYYARQASETFRKDDCDSLCPNDLGSVTTDTAPLSAIFFGKDEFRGENAFVGGQIVNQSAPPVLIFSRIIPRFEYQEWGVFTGVNVYREFKRSEDAAWRAGLSVALPFKIIEVQQRVGCGTVFEDLENVRQLKIEDEGDQAYQQVAAYRLDFLTSLQLPNGEPMVVYGDGTVANRTMIAGYVVAGSTDQADNSAINGNVPVHVLGRPDGTVVPVDVAPGNGALGGVPYAEDHTPGFSTNNIGNPLPASGALAENERAFFIQTGQNYLNNLALDRDAQGKIFVVPRQTDEVTTDDSIAIMNIVEEVLANGIGATSAQEFFQACCISFCNSENIAGVGDLDTTAYVGWHGDSGSYLDFQLGARWPTAKKNTDPRRLLYQQPGNNGHIELHLGLIGGWRPRDWFAVSADASYTHVFKALEKRAGTFAGATVVNIGPLVNANVSWNAVVGHIDLNFFHPRNRDLGTEIGYEIYARSKDKLSFCRETAVDCLGRLEPLDSCLAASLSKTLTNKIRGETFYRIGFGEIFVGGSHIFAGRYAMKESEWHVGMQIWF